MSCQIKEDVRDFLPSLFVAIGSLKTRTKRKINHPNEKGLRLELPEALAAELLGLVVGVRFELTTFGL